MTAPNLHMFISDRLDAIEALAQAVAESGTSLGFISESGAARILDDVEAKRAILAEHEVLECAEHEAWPCPYGYPRCIVCEEDNCPTIRALAHPDRDHADFDPAWGI